MGWFSAMSLVGMCTVVRFAWRRRALAAPEPVPMVECERGCEVPRDTAHVVFALADDDAALGIEAGGQTAMSQDYCAEHCPGGCLRGCVPSTP